MPRTKKSKLKIFSLKNMNWDYGGCLSKEEERKKEFRNSTKIIKIKKEKENIFLKEYTFKIR